VGAVVDVVAVSEIPLEDEEPSFRLRRRFQWEL